MTTKKGELPLTAVSWFLIVEPLEPKEETAGGLVIARETKEAEEAIMTVGQILQLGSLCFTGVTKSGISLGDQNPKPKVGDYVMYQRYTGQRITVRREGGAIDRDLLIIKDSEIIAIVDRPDDLRFII